MGCCDLKTRCIDTFTRDEAIALATEWNAKTLDEVWTEIACAKFNLENGDLLLVRSSDSVIFKNHGDDMDGLLEYLKSECARDFSVSYDICQLLDGNLVHLSNSRILAKVGDWKGFDISLMTEVEE